MNPSNPAAFDSHGENNVVSRTRMFTFVLARDRVSVPAWIRYNPVAVGWKIVVLGPRFASLGEPSNALSVVVTPAEASTVPAASEYNSTGSMFTKTPSSRAVHTDI
jgi:hypothetical protein